MLVYLLKLYFDSTFSIKLYIMYEIKPRIKIPVITKSILKT